MLHIETFVFNPLQENTYLVSDPAGNALIIDPGCLQGFELEQLKLRISQRGLKPQAVLLTHAHLDHVFGVYAVCNAYNIPMLAHENSLPMLAMLPDICRMYGLPPCSCRNPDQFISENDILQWGEIQLECLFIPGHSPDHLVFVSHAQQCIIGGDVLFSNSIGRTDLPGGSHQQLIQNIKEKLFTLPDSYRVYPGHGPQTLIGTEKMYNPFLQE